MSVKLEIVLPQQLFDQLASAARISCQPVSAFAREVLESDLASRKLQTIPPIPKKPGGPPDLLERLNLK